MSETLRLDRPKHLRAEMARAGLAPQQLASWWSPDTDSMVNPLASDEARATVRDFMVRLWAAALVAEGGQGGDDNEH